MKKVPGAGKGLRSTPGRGVWPDSAVTGILVQPVMCQHAPACPAASAPDREAAQVIACHPGQGWSLLCNGVVIFDDTGELLPNGATIAPHRPNCSGPQAPAA